MHFFPRKTAVAALVAGLCCTGAQAATLPVVTIDRFDRAAYDRAIADLAQTIVEDFESVSPGEVRGGLQTRVGVFDTLGERGSGGTVRGTRGNSGKGVFVRDGDVFGRSNTTKDGDSYLDSNDTRGLSWTISGLGMFDRLFFTISDVADTGATFTLHANETQVGPTLRKRKNRAIDMVMLSFGTAVDSFTLDLRHSKLNDGFSIDDVVVGRSVLSQQPPAAIPLPPAAALLLGGVAALALMRRRRHG